MNIPEGYREVPIEDVKPGTRVLVAVEPEPEAIWEFKETANVNGFKILEDGSAVDVREGVARPFEPEEECDVAVLTLAKDYASLYARNKANEEKLREIKEFATQMYTVRQDPFWPLVQLCREIEV